MFWKEKKDMLCVSNLLVVINKLVIFQLLVKKKRVLHPYFETKTNKNYYRFYSADIWWTSLTAVQFNLLHKDYW